MGVSRSGIEPVFAGGRADLPAARRVRRLSSRRWCAREQLRFGLERAAAARPVTLAPEWYPIGSRVLLNMAAPLATTHKLPS